MKYVIKTVNITQVTLLTNVTCYLTATSLILHNIITIRNEVTNEVTNLVSDPLSNA